MIRLSMQRARQGHLPVARQFAEMVWLWAANGIKPSDYLCVGLYRRALSWRDKAEHLGGRRYLRALRRVNDRRLEYVALNKLVGYGLLRTFGIPTPPIHALIGAGSPGPGTTPRLDGPDDLGRLLRSLPGREAAFKLVSGWNGRGFVRVRVEEDSGRMVVVRSRDGRAMSLDEFWDEVLAHRGAYMVQSVVRSHPGVAAYHPASLNTVRVWMVRPGQNDWTPFASIFRIGRSGSSVDNDGHNLVAPVRVADGTLGIAIDEAVERNEFPVHPDSGVPIAGRVLPDWPEAIGLCRRAARLLPFLRLVAFDVALTATGPVIMELESIPGDDQVGFDRGVRSLLAELATRDAPIGQAVPVSRRERASSSVSTASTIS